MTVEGHRRLVAQVLDEGRPQAHVAAESRPARATVRTWVGQFRAGGETALADRSSRPHHSPTRTDPAVVARIEKLRRDRKLPPRLIVEELTGDGIKVSAATVHRWLHRLGISRLRDLDVTGNSHRQIRRIITERPLSCPAFLGQWIQSLHSDERRTRESSKEGVQPGVP